MCRGFCVHTCQSVCVCWGFVTISVQIKCIIVIDREQTITSLKQVFEGTQHVALQPRQFLKNTLYLSTLSISHTQDFNFPLFPLNTPRGVYTVILTGCTSSAASLKFPQFDCDKHTNPLHYQGNAEDAATFLGPAVKTWKSQCWILAVSVLVHYWSLTQLCGMHSACSSSSGQGVPALAGRKRMYRVRWRTPPLEQGPRHKPQDDQRDTSQSNGVTVIRGKETQEKYSSYVSKERKAKNIPAETRAVSISMWL